MKKLVYSCKNCAFCEIHMSKALKTKAFSTFMRRKYYKPLVFNGFDLRFLQKALFLQL